MKNVDYFTGVSKMSLVDAFDLYVRRRGLCRDGVGVVQALNFAAANAMTTLEWNVGDVVQVAQPGSNYHGKYATVDSFGERAYMTNAGEGEAALLYLRVAGKEDSLVEMWAHHVRKPDFPPELVELVRSQIGKCPVDFSKCPLKDEGACMK